MPASLPDFRAAMAQRDTTRPRTVIGLMSGTSVDSIDACCATLWLEAGRFRFEIRATYTHDIPDSLRQELLAVMSPNPVPLETLCRLNVAVGNLFAEAAWGLTQTANLATDSIDAVGSHGQTVYHLPPSAAHPLGATLQIGEPSLIAERTGWLTVADFRPRDMAAWGHGAPLVCFADALLFGDGQHTRCVQNIGGIANVTVVPASGPMLAFDTGPGNMLMDAAMERFYNQSFDEDGQIAAQGQVNTALLGTLLADPYFQEPPPKTTGRERFGHQFLTALLTESSDLAPADWVATLTAFTAQSIVQSYQRFIFPRWHPTEMIVGGGGLMNPTLLKMLSQGFEQVGHPLQIQGHEAYGVPSKYKEALAFAMLAWAALEGIPNNVPDCTGAHNPVVMGKILPGHRRIQIS